MPNRIGTGGRRVGGGERIVAVGSRGVRRVDRAAGVDRAGDEQHGTRGRWCTSEGQ